MSVSRCWRIVIAVTQWQFTVVERRCWMSMSVKVANVKISALTRHDLVLERCEARSGVRTSSVQKR